MKTNKNAMSKIAQINKPTELAAIKVNLSFQQDIDKFVDEVFDEIDYSEKINKVMDAAWAKARNAIQDLAKATQEVKDHLPALDVKSDAKALQDKIKTAADELGVKPSAVKGYDSIADAVQEANKQLQDAKINIKDSKPPKA